MGGRLSSYFFGREVRALIVGLDASGKTTLLYRLKLGEVVTTIPTIGFNVETVHHKNLSITAWDVGGRSKMRALVRHYFANTQVLIYMVDSADRERLPEVREELASLLQEDEIRDAVLLVLANKQDLDGSMSLEEVSNSLDFPALTRQRVAAIFPVSALGNVGIAEAMDWMASKVAEKQAEKYLTNRVLSRVGCGAFKKVWSVKALLKSTLSSAQSLLYGQHDRQVAGSGTNN